MSLRPSAIALLALFAGCGVTWLAACGGDTTTDAGPDLGMPDSGGMDAGTDAGPMPQPAVLFGPCTADSDCPGTGAVCRRAADGWPSGYCTVPCTDRTPCDDGASYNHCIDDGTGTGHSFCEFRCLNGGDCRDGYSCEGSYPPADGRCIPVCSDDAQCGAGATCQAQTARCAATGTPAPTGAAVGAPCASGAECASGACDAELTATGRPTGFVRGQCVRNCVLPAGYNSTNVFSGPDLPQSDCEAGAVCIPTGTAMAMLDLGVCVAACHSNADCRVADGYACAQDFGTAHFGTGFCRPADCAAMGAAPCPTGYACQTATSGAGFCARM